VLFLAHFLAKTGQKHVFLTEKMDKICGFWCKNELKCAARGTL